MDPATNALAWVNSVLDAWEKRGRKIPEHRYYLACANMLRIEQKMDAHPHGTIKPIMRDWEQLKVRLDGHRP